MKNSGRNKELIPDSLKEERAMGFKSREGTTIIKTKEKKAQALRMTGAQLFTGQ